jgi:hypothetical protein
VPEPNQPEADERPRRSLRPWADSSLPELKFELPRELGELMYEYRAFRESKPWKAIWRWATHAKVKEVILEREYIDADYRDEFSHFYAHVFEQLPNRCERLHFLGDDGYLGFVSLRPIRKRPVSRTMLTPPRSDVACLAKATAQVFEERFEFETFPYISQDARYGVCAHACIWMVAYYHHLRHQTRRIFMSDIVDAARLPHETFRINPSGGLSVEQMSAAFRELDLPAITYPVDALTANATAQVLGERKPDKRVKAVEAREVGPAVPQHHEGADGQATSDDQRELSPEEQARVVELTRAEVERVICPYLNSRLPVVVVTDDHATVLVGYGRRRGKDHLYFVRHDDSLQPYGRVKAWNKDRRGSWALIMVPLPGRIYLAGEIAEGISRQQLHALVTDKSDLEHLVDADTRIRSYCIRAFEYKQQMVERGLPDDVRASQARTPTSNWIWITELQDRNAAKLGKRCVIGELALDATCDAEDPQFLFANFPGTTYLWDRDHDDPAVVANSREPDSLVDSGTALHVADA